MKVDSLSEPRLNLILSDSLGTRGGGPHPLNKSLMPSRQLWFCTFYNCDVDLQITIASGRYSDALKDDPSKYVQISMCSSCQFNDFIFVIAGFSPTIAFYTRQHIGVLTQGINSSI